MNLWRRLLIAIGAPLALAFLLALVSAPPALTQGTPNRAPTPVEVTNVPLPVMGNVSATLGGPVQVQQSGPWAVRVQDDQLNVPFNVADFGLLNAGGFAFTFLFDVPEGQRLVIENVSVASDAPPGQAFDWRLITAANGNEIQGPLSTTIQGVNAQGRELRVGTQEFSARMDGTATPGDLAVVVSRSPDAGIAQVRATVRGYLVPLP